MRRIGGTDIAKLFGLSKYGGPRSVYDRLVIGTESKRTPVMERGNREEPRIRQMFVDETCAILAPHPGRDMVNPKYEFASISPDDFAMLCGEDTTIDYKSVSVWAAKKWGTSHDAMPDDYAMQIRWAMAVTEKNHAACYTAFGEDLDDFRVFAIRWCRLYRIERDIEIEAAMLDVAERFWVDHVLPGKPPQPDPKPAKKPKQQLESANV